MESFIDRNIEKWVKIVNSEYGLSDKNSFSIDYFKSIKNICHFIFRENWYLIYGIYPDLWGNLELNIMSYYIMPKYRNATNFKKIQGLIDIIARRYKTRYIIQGSHLNDKIFKYLSSKGYKQSTMKLEIK